MDGSEATAQVASANEIQRVSCDADFMGNGSSVTCYLLNVGKLLTSASERYRISQRRLVGD